MTLGEVLIVIDAHHERERQTLLSRLNAVLRGLSTLGKRRVDPYKGLEDKSKADRKSVASFSSQAKKVFKPAGGTAVGAVSDTANSVRDAFRRAREKRFWGE